MTALLQSLPSPVETVLLFGSRSRNDADSNSDTDLAIFAKVDSFAGLTKIKSRLSSRVSDNVNLSVYSTLAGQSMSADGSLFLWHLKLEGKILFRRTSWIEQVFESLAPYSSRKALRDLDTFETVLGDIGSGLNNGHHTLLFEAATEFSVLRSLGMILSFFVGTPCFGRLEPISRTREVMGRSCPLDENEIRQLLSARLAYARKITCNQPVLTAEWCNRIRIKITKVLEFTKEFINETVR